MLTPATDDSTYVYLDSEEELGILVELLPSDHKEE